MENDQDQQRQGKQVAQVHGCRNTGVGNGLTVPGNGERQKVDASLTDHLDCSVTSPMKGWFWPPTVGQSLP